MQTFWQGSDGSTVPRRSQAHALEQTLGELSGSASATSDPLASRANQPSAHVSQCWPAVWSAQAHCPPEPSDRLPGKASSDALYTQLVACPLQLHARHAIESVDVAAVALALTYGLSLYRGRHCSHCAQENCLECSLFTVRVRYCSLSMSNLCTPVCQSCRLPRRRRTCRAARTCRRRWPSRCSHTTRTRKSR